MWQSGEEGVLTEIDVYSWRRHEVSVTGQMNDLFEWMNREKENVYPLTCHLYSL